MRSAAALLLVLLTGPLAAPAAWAQSRLAAGFDLPGAASVITAALTFIAPRALDPVTVRQLALWGLSAPASLDATLSTDVSDGAAILLQSGKPILTRPLPASDDPAAWAALVAAILAGAADASPDFRAAGTQGALASFFDELFNHLDPYSRYVPPAAAEGDRARRSGEAGPGVTVIHTGPAVRGAFVVAAVNANGPGAEAGITAGDRILAIDGQPIAGEDLDTVQSLLAGEEGSTLTITLRGRRGPVRTLDVERAVTPPETVFASRSNDLLLIRITAFSVDTDQRLETELERYLTPPAARTVRGVVLDLRGNRGGLLRQAVAAINLLLSHGAIATTAGRDPDANHQWVAAAGDVTDGRPVIMLVDGRTASAAEIMAAALADNGRGVAVGSATLGKGLVQTIGTMPGGGELFVSWSRVLAPGGWPLQSLGVLPQICTSLGEDALAQQLQDLERGSQPMAAALARHNAARAPLPAAEALALRSPCPAAEARDADLTAARFLLAHPAAYEAALLTPPPFPTAPTAAANRETTASPAPTTR